MRASSLKTFILALLISTAGSLQAQISVGVGGSGVITFDTLPGVTNFSTRTIPGANPDMITPAGLDTVVQTNTAAIITTVLPTDTSATNAAATSANFRWRSDATFGQHLASRSTGGSGNLLLATLRNDANSNANSLTIDYDFGVLSNGPPTQNIVEDPGLAGFRVYYSLSGLANSWTVIPGLSVSNASHLHVTVDLSWPPSSLLYLLWADDNGIPGSGDVAAGGNVEGCYTIDNFSVVPTLGAPICPGITNGPANVTVNRCPTNSATFSISTTGSVQGIQWYRKDGAGPFTEIAGANSLSYSLNPATLADSGAQFQAVVTNSSCSSVTSGTATLTVLPDTTKPTVRYTVASTNLLNITIVFSEPVDTNNADLSGAWSIVDTNDGSQVFLAGQSFPNSTTLILDLDAGTPLNLAHGYTLALDSVVDVCAGNIIDPVTVPIGHPIVLIDFDVDNVWKYDINNGSRIGTGWQTVGFDDSAWPSGPAGLGHESDLQSTNFVPFGIPGTNGVPIRTHLDYRTNAAVAYFRRHFDLPTTTNGVSLTIRHVFEDGAVVYLNGQEAGRYQVPAGVVIATNTLSTGALADPTPISGSLSLSNSALVAGDNVIAVLVLQSAATSSDLEMALELTAITPAALTPRPRLAINRNGANLVINWTGAGTLQRSTNISSTANWVTIPGATSGFQTNTTSRSNQFFRVTVP